MRKCRKCNKTIFDDQDLKVVITPEMIHTAKLVCPHCGHFIKWQNKEEYKYYKAMKEANFND